MTPAGGLDAVDGAVGAAAEADDLAVLDDVDARGASARAGIAPGDGIMARGAAAPLQGARP